MNLRDVLQVLFKRRWLLLGFFAAVLIGAVAALKLISPTYEATAQLLVKLGQEDIYMPALTSSQFRAPVMSVVREEQLHSEANILLDGALARQVVRQLTPPVIFPGIDVVHPWYTPKGWLQRLTWLYAAMEDFFFPLSAGRSIEDKAVDAFGRAVKAEAVKSANTIEVSMRNKSPDAAALGVNTLIQLYLQERVRIHQREQSDFFSGQLKLLDSQITQAEQALSGTRSSSRIVDVDKQRTADVDSLNDVRKRLDDNGVAVAQTRKRLQVLKAQLGDTPASVQVGGSESANSLALSEIQKQIADIARREADIRQRFSDQDPRLTGLAEERRALQGLYDQQMNPRMQSAQQGMNPLHARLRDDLLQTEAQLAALQQGSAQLQTLQTQIETRLGQLAGAEQPWQEQVQQLKVLRESRQLYLQKSEEARLSAAQAAAKLGNVAVVSEAAVPTKPVSPKLWLVMIGVLVGGLLGGVALAFAVEFLDDRLASDRETERVLGVPVLTQLPELVYDAKAA